MSFEIWLKEGRLKRHKPARQEIASLAALADRRLAALTMRADQAEVSVLDAWRKKRHRATYDGAEVSEHELLELIALVEKLQVEFSAWLRAEHPKLGPGARPSP